MRVLGLDPGSHVTGWGVLDCQDGNIEPLEWGALRTDRTAPFDDRLLALKEGLLQIVRRLEPSTAAVEDPFYARNAASALKLGQVRGVLVVALREAGVGVETYAPRAVKKAVSGFGGAEKTQVGAMVQRLLGLDRIPEPADAADALAVAVCHTHIRGLGTAGSPAARSGLKHPVRG
jgi:crossover junction endodeoxyribonuclease RuvC